MSENVNIGLVPHEEMLEHLEEVRSTRLMINKVDQWLYDRVAPYLGNRLLEIGAGHGNFLSFVEDRELVVATDFEPTAVEVIRRSFADKPNIQPEVLDICSPVDPRFWEMGIDTVYSVNAFEHIEDDQLGINHIAEILPEGGRLVMIVPAHMFAYGRMDLSIGHYRRYSKQMMRDRISTAGLQTTEQVYINALGLAGWFVNARILRKKTPPEGQLALFNRLVPTLRFLESIAPPPVGLTLLTIAEK